MSQTTVNTDPAVAREGMLADAGPKRVISRIADEDIPAGRVLSVGAAAGGCKLPASAGDVTAGNVLGISMYLASREPHTETAEYAHEDMVSIVRKGLVWMVAEDAVAEGGSVFVRHTAAGGEELGRVRSDADGTDAVAIEGMRYDSATSGADELALVELNLPA